MVAVLQARVDTGRDWRPEESPLPGRAGDRSSASNRRRTRMTPARVNFVPASASQFPLCRSSNANRRRRSKAPPAPASDRAIPRSTREQRTWNVARSRANVRGQTDRLRGKMFPCAVRAVVESFERESALAQRGGRTKKGPIHRGNRPGYH